MKFEINFIACTDWRSMFSSSTGIWNQWTQSWSFRAHINSVTEQQASVNLHDCLDYFLLIFNLKINLCIV